ncbi:acetyl-CoA carboxylase biotin carboxyl carrier protein [Microbacterium lacus]|uniref:acetyl-CoA carboxylase biotin carboxyl carrier protein n=1 Tax=Microbacterium lacus TaxID=415217 RepID=UPI00384D59E6
MPLNPPDIKELKAIVDWVHLSDDVRELSLKYGDVELFISRNHAPVAQPAGATPNVAVQAPLAAPLPAAAADPVAVTPAAPGPVAPVAGGGIADGDVMVKAPMLGTFYSAPKPGAANFVEVGARVEVGAVLCIVEVMKLMNNVEAPVAGMVTSILAQNNETVEYGQPLIVIRTDG